MRRIKAMGVAGIAVLAVGAMTTASASAAKLTLSEGEGGPTLSPGALIEPYGGEDRVFIETSKGTIECGAFVRGELHLATNSKGKDELEVTHLEGGNLGGPCRSFTGNAYINVSVGGPLDLRASGKASSGGARLSIVFEHIEFHEGFECVYTGKHLNGSNTATPTRQQLAVELGATLRLDTSASSFGAKSVCPKTAAVEIAGVRLEAGESGVIEEQI